MRRKMNLRTNPTPKVIIFCLTLVLLISFSASVLSDPTSEESEVEETDDLEELIALDEQEERSQERHHQQHSEAELLTKAQRIVLELNNDNAKRAINENEFVMVLGYAPWCSRSAEIMPQFAEAATRLKEMGSTILMAKVDAERYTKVASQLEIKGYPTLLLFVNGSSQAYTGGLSAEDIVIWARKRTGAPVVRISLKDEAEGFLKKYHTFVLGHFDEIEGHDHQEFMKAAIKDNEIQFVETNDFKISKILFPGIKPSKVFIGIIKSEPERYTAYEGTNEADKILEFVEINKFPLITKLTDINAISVYSSPIKLQVIVFATADDFKDMIQPLEDVARKFKSKLMFIYIDIANDNLAKPFLTLLGMEDSESTVVAAFESRNNKKFLLESDPSPNNIEEFCSGLVHDTVSPFYKSQPIPDNENASVLAVVGKTFDDMVLKNPENVVLEVYTTWCIPCETLSKQVEKLAKHFKGMQNLVFARIDAAANEHPKLQFDDYPSLLLYRAGEKDNPVKLSTKSSSKDMAISINQRLNAKEHAARDEL